MIAAIHQPDYIPYIGYFYKIKKADLFIFLDDAQFSTSGGHDWNLIKTPNGPARLKIPVQQTLGDAINQVRTKDELDWKAKHLKAISQHYQAAPYFSEAFGVYQELLAPSYASIAELNAAIVARFCAECGIHTPMLNSSSLKCAGKKEQRIFALCRAVGADTYFSGTGAKAYQSEAQYNENGIKLVYSDYTPIRYPQMWGRFVENLSVVDYVMNCGFNLKGL